MYLRRANTVVGVRRPCVRVRACVCGNMAKSSELVQIDTHTLAHTLSRAHTLITRTRIYAYHVLFLDISFFHHVPTHKTLLQLRDDVCVPQGVVLDWEYRK
jgi:hypothetical protein